MNGTDDSHELPTVDLLVDRYSGALDTDGDLAACLVTLRADWR